jgi:hypothetical protein
MRRWVVVAAVVALAILLGLQLHALARLQQSAAATQRTALRSYTSAMRSLEDFYRLKARAALDLGPGAAGGRSPTRWPRTRGPGRRGVRQFFVVAFRADGRGALASSTPRRALEPPAARAARGARGGALAARRPGGLAASRR